MKRSICLGKQMSIVSTLMFGKMMRKVCDFFVKTVCLAFALLCQVNANADEANPNLWMNVTIETGEEVYVRWVGDEHFHYLTDSIGNIYMSNGKGSFAHVDNTTFQQRRDAFLESFFAQEESGPNIHKLSMSEREYFPDRSNFLGSKKGLVVLIEFGDNNGKGGTDTSTALKFSTDVIGDPVQHFNNFFNKENFNEGSFIGSVHDYFYDQSYGKFDLTFDVIGPVQVSRSGSYYAGDGGLDNCGELAKEVLELIDDEVDFTKYDWNGDGCVNQVGFVCAGGAPSQGGSIWAHKNTMERALGSTITLDGKILNAYCMCNELTVIDNKKAPAGIGCFVHEYSHCFGFPDLYDVNHWSGYGVGCFDLMGSGSNNGDGYIPAGYSAYERMIMGWLEPVALNEPSKIRNMTPLSENGETYIIYTDNPDSTEYYIMENRQCSRWDAAMPAYGLLIYRVDFSPKAWAYNYVNSPRYIGITLHERFRVINADDNPLWVYSNGGYYVIAKYQTGVPFPQPGHDSFSDSTSPQMIQYNGTDTKYPLYNRELTNITQNEDGTISFDFHLPDEEAPTYHGLYLDENTVEPVSYEASADEKTLYNVHTNMLLKTNRWLTMWLPFSLTDEEVQAAFGANTRVALFTSGSDNSLKFYTTEEGIPANTPVLVYLENENDLQQVATMPRRILPESSNGLTEAVHSKVGPFSFIGVSTATVVPENCYFISNGTLYRSAGTTKLKAFKGYFDADGNTINSMVLDIEEDGHETYVDDCLVSVGDNTLGDIYTMNGVLVRKGATTTEGLPKGLYLLNGKKIVVR